MQWTEHQFIIIIEICIRGDKTGDDLINRSDGLRQKSDGLRQKSDGSELID